MNNWVNIPGTCNADYHGWVSQKVHLLLDIFMKQETMERIGEVIPTKISLAIKHPHFTEANN